MTRPRFLNLRDGGNLPPRRDWLDTAAAAFVALVVVGGMVLL
jgi:hypothetical protein